MPELSSHGTVSNMRGVFQPRCPKGCAEGHKPKPVAPHRRSRSSRSFPCARAFDGAGSRGGGGCSLGHFILTIQAEPPAVDPFDMSFFAATVAARDFFAYPIFAPLL